MKASLINRRPAGFDSSPTLSSRLRALLIAVCLSGAIACQNQSEPISKPESETTEATIEVSSYLEALRSDLQQELLTIDRDLDKLSASISDSSMGQEELVPVLTELQTRQQELLQDLVVIEANSLPDYESTRNLFWFRINDLEKDIEAMRFKAIEERALFEDSIEYRLKEIDLELLDVQRRIDATQAPTTTQYRLELDTLRSEYEFLTERFQILSKAHTDSFVEERDALVDDVASLSAALKNTTQSLISLNSRQESTSASF